MKKIQTIVVFCFFAQLLAAQIPTQGLIRYYPFNGDAKDWSANAQHGTVNGATLTSDRFGNPASAYAFDAIAPNFIQIPVNGLLNDALTFSCWAKLASYPAFEDRYWVISVGSTSGDQSLYFNNFLYGELGWQCANYNTPQPINSFQDRRLAELDEWYHLIVAKDEQKSTFYVNGIKIDSIIYPVPTPAYYGVGTPVAKIGIRFDNTLPFNGAIDEVRIYDRAITSAEAKSLYRESQCIERISVTDTLIINTTSNVSGVQPDYEIKIYPNPTKDHIVINYGNFQDLAGYSLQITNAAGTTVFTEAIIQAVSQVNITTWVGNGTYFVYLKAPDGSIVDVRKLIVL